MGLKIFIVGSGICGPVAACALTLKGHQVSVFEQAKQGTDVGYAFRINGNADLCLKHIGVNVLDGGATISRGVKQFDEHGKLKFARKENTNVRDSGSNSSDDDESDEKSWVGANYFAYRPNVVKQLLDRAKELGITVHYGAKVTSVNVQDTSLTLDDGSIHSADLIIAADGIHVSTICLARPRSLTSFKSVVRPFIVPPKDREPKYTGRTACIRFNIDYDSLKHDEMCKDLLTPESPMAVWRRSDPPLKACISYVVDHGKVANLSLLYPDQTDSDADGRGDGYSKEQQIAYDQGITMDKVLETFQEFDPRLKQLIKLANLNGFRYWKLHDFDATPTWHKGRVILLGDAAHAVLPTGFAGAAMAVEDGVMLAELMPKDTKVADVESVFQTFEKLRMSRIDFVREHARKGAANANDRQADLDYMDFLVTYDGIAAADKVAATASASA